MASMNTSQEMLVLFWGNFQECFWSTFSKSTSWVNGLFGKAEPWEIVIFTVIMCYLVASIFNSFCNLFIGGVAHTFWFYVRKLPIVKGQVQKKLKDTSDDIEHQFQKGLENKVYLQCLPKKGWKNDAILKEIGEYEKFGHYLWREGYASGAVYINNNEKLENLVHEVFSRTAYTNPLHPDIFPGARIMEAEIVKMVSSLFNAPHSIGTVTSGGTESIFLACKAYRDYAKFEKGIIEPNMVIPITAHAAFDKAAQLLNIKVKHVKVHKMSMKVDIRALKRAINGSTILLVGSCPGFPHGCIDPIQDISKIGAEKNVPVHVDACLGGFLVPFMKKAGFEVPRFDFSLKGVTSISIDTHKYAYAPKGTSVLLFRDKIYRHYQFSIQPDWPGGIYGTQNLSGSRSGGIIATCWASLLFHGEESYVESTKKIISVTRKVEKGLRQIRGIFVYGKPEVSVLAIGSNDFDIYRLSGALGDRGWNLSQLQFPPAFHMCFTLQHTVAGVAERFLSHVEECTLDILKQPKLKNTGSAAIYGMAQQLPDRSLVTQIVWSYLDAYYSIKNTKKDD